VPHALPSDNLVGCARHAEKWGCWWNRDINQIVEEAGLVVHEKANYHLGFLSLWHFALFALLLTEPDRDWVCHCCFTASSSVFRKMSLNEVKRFYSIVWPNKKNIKIIGVEEAWSSILPPAPLVLDLTTFLIR